MNLIIKNFILGGIFISFGSYFINEVDAGLAGLLAPMPISIFLYFFIDPNKATDFTITHAIAISVTFLITWLYYYLFLYHKSNQYVKQKDEDLQVLSLSRSLQVTKFLLFYITPTTVLKLIFLLS